MSSQQHKKKSSRKGGSKTDPAKSKQGVGMSTRASEEKSKPSEPGKVEAAKPMSSTSKSSVKPGAAATQKSADSCKSKTKSGSSVLPGAAGGVKQQQPQSTATSQSKMGQLFGKTSNVDAKENQDRTQPEKLTGTSLHKNNDSKIQDGKPMLSAMEQLMEPFPSQGPDAPIPKCTGPAAKDEDPFDLLAGTLPSEEPDKSIPEYTGPKVKESDATKKKGERVGEHEDTIPPDYRFKDQPDPKNKDKPASSSTGPGTKLKTTEKTMAKDDAFESLAADFGEISAEPLSKSSAATAHCAPPPSAMKQAPLQASTAATVSTSRTVDKDKDAFDLLADSLPSEAPDTSGPKYTGPPVKESDVNKQHIDRMGDRDDTLPPEYRFKEQPAPKDKGPLASSTDAGAKPKIMTEGDVLESLSADFGQSSTAPISKCSAAISQFVEPPSIKQQPSLQASKAAPVSSTQTGMKAPDKDSLSKTPLQASKAAPVSASLPGSKAPDKDSLSKAPLQASKAAPVSASQPDPKLLLQASKAAPVSTSQTSQKAPDKDSLSKAPLQASKAAPVSASLPGPKGKDPFDLLAETLPSEAPDDSAPKYTGPEVKESDATKKKGVRVGEREDTIPPDYRFKEQPGPKDKLAPSGTGTGAKPKTMTEDDVMDYMSADIMQSSTAPISKCSAATIHATAPPSTQIEAPLQASKAAPVSAGQTGAKLSEKVKDPLDLLAETLPSEAPDDSSPKFTGLAVKESDVTKKKGERVGEHESTIPPDYRFKEQTDPKDKGKLAPSFTDPGAKPKVMTKDDMLDSLSGDFGLSSVAPISKCSVAPPQFATLPSKQKEAMTDDDFFGSLSGDFVSSSDAPISKCSVAPPQFATLPSNQKEAPLKASAAASVSASQTHAKDKDPFDLLAATLPSEAPDNSAPKYSGPEVKVQTKFVWNFQSSRYRCTTFYPKALGPDTFRNSEFVGLRNGNFLA
ncbi:calpastatin isoform X10 [Leucoraja erinacea]|uniref:calpastatin isoform X10 n=1 Tax=Leucoraja erinaceus TaxID=7782 RepID=UPI002453E60C|nr:calpastatin isoform X10 [Leucoraja erinacea]